MTCTCPTTTEVLFVPANLRGPSDGSHKRVTETIHRLGCDVGKHEGER